MPDLPGGEVPVADALCGRVEQTPERVPDPVRRQVAAQPPEPLAQREEGQRPPVLPVDARPELGVGEHGGVPRRGAVQVRRGHQGEDQFLQRRVEGGRSRWSTRV
ncbi:hypothetical protein [Streptomyces sp. NPDC002587]